MTKASTKASPNSIKYWNRAHNRIETEKVFGDAWVELLYGTRPGQLLAEKLVSGRLLSQLYGVWQATPFSRRKIPAFIRAFQIPMEEYDRRIFSSFNDFFIRRFRDGVRPFCENAHALPAPAEARYFAYATAAEHFRFNVKGIDLSPPELLGSLENSRPFLNGPMLLARLCPVDYHRFHYPDDGTTLDSYRLHGQYHSVNPKALAYRGDILLKNERQVSILETKNFGKLAYVEVGALCVGRIIQTHPASASFERGDEKGYFLFGASTIILLGEPGRWIPDSDLLENTQQGIETLVKLGESVALATPTPTLR